MLDTYRYTPKLKFGGMGGGKQWGVDVFHQNGKNFRDPEAGNAPLPLIFETLENNFDDQLE